MPVQRSLPNISVHGDRDTELRRARGQLSCAECRRLKLKCDKKVPCSSCKRRRCENICPNGVLKGGQDSKLEKLQQKLATMSKRIHQLEIALQAECTSHSNPPITHPLLTDDLLDIKNGIFLFENPEGMADGATFADAENQKHEDEEEEEDIVNSLGMLSVTEGGETRFVGQSGFQQMVFMAESSDENPHEDLSPSGSGSNEARPSFPPQLVQTRGMWPFVPNAGDVDELQDLIEAQLPPYERASSLVETFLENYSWFFRPVDREQIVEDLFPGAYRRGPNAVCTLHNDENNPPERMDPHDLALLLMVLSSGASFDLTLPEDSRDAFVYQELAGAALGLKSVFQSTSLSAVQAISLVATFEFTRKNSLESAWKLMCLAFSLAVSIGLHRDPARWKIEPKMIQRRRRAFWEIYMNSAWMCLCSGRPMTFAPDVVDCEFPLDTEATVAEDGTVIPSFTRWKHRFMKDVLALVTARLCTAQPLKYSDILDLDQRIREFNKLQNQYTAGSSPADWSHDTPSQTMQRFSTIFFKEIGLLYIHRMLFARALLDYPQNPLRSPFAPSFLAAYRSATTLLKVLRENFDRYAHLFVRTWLIWAHAFSSAIIVGSVVSRGPSSELAPAAFFELGQAISVFKKASAHPIARQGLPIPIRVHNKAQRALYQQHSSVTHLSQQVSSVPSKEDDDSNDELNLLRGTTRIVVRKKPRKSHTRDSSLNANTSTPADAPSPASTVSSGDTAPSTGSDGRSSSLPHQSPNSSQSPQAINGASAQQQRSQQPLPQAFYGTLQSPTQTAVPNAYAHSPSQTQAAVGLPWQSIPSPSSQLFETMPGADGMNNALQMGYYDMDINVSDVNFDLSSLLSNDSPPWPTTFVSSISNSLGTMGTPPPLPSFPMDQSMVTGMGGGSGVAPSRTGEDMAEAWRSFYMGSTPNYNTGDPLDSPPDARHWSYANPS